MEVSHALGSGSVNSLFQYVNWTNVECSQGRRPGQSRTESKRSMIFLRLAVGFEEDRARLGLLAAVDRLRDGSAYNGVTLGRPR